MARVILNAGHGGNDPGGIYNRRVEKVDNLRLVLAVGAILSERGVEVRYLRTTDNYISPIQRARAANELGGDLLVDIHRGYPTVSNESGVRAYVFQEGGLAENTALIVLDNLSGIGFFNNGINIRENVYLLRFVELPTFQLVVGYISSVHDDELFDSEFDAIAGAIADGIIESFRQHGILL